jgi:hypothetical protein
MGHNGTAHEKRTRDIVTKDKKDVFSLDDSVFVVPRI